jgi:hypothetical protein
MRRDAEDAYAARPVKCHACAAKANAAAAFEGRAGGVYWAVDRER